MNQENRVCMGKNVDAWMSICGKAWINISMNDAGEIAKVYLTGQTPER
jgi:hypothetical protein